ncbi:MAG: hypothetical protein ABIB79_01730 [archaeon]
MALDYQEATRSKKSKEERNKKLELKKKAEVKKLREQKTRKAVSFLESRIDKSIKYGELSHGEITVDLTNAEYNDLFKGSLDNKFFNVNWRDVLDSLEAIYFPSGWKNLTMQDKPNGEGYYLILSRKPSEGTFGYSFM